MIRRNEIALVNRAMACWLAAGALRLAAAEPWDPVEPALLAESAPRLDPDAPAEAVFRKLTIDDRGYPQWTGASGNTTGTRSSIRKRRTSVTRISGIEATVDGERRSAQLELRARLTLPDGSSREFGNESLQQRALVSIGSEQSWLQRLLGGRECRGQ